MADAFDAALDFGWSVRANTSVASGVAYLDLTGRDRPTGRVHGRNLARSGRSARDQGRLRDVARQGRQGRTDLLGRDEGNPTERCAVAQIAALYDCDRQAAGEVNCVLHGDLPGTPGR